jgi:mannose-6-phosphate isomerase
LLKRTIPDPDPEAIRHSLPPEPFRIEPIFSPRIWGSRSLAPLFPEKTNLGEPIGEVWLTGMDCRVATGPFAGKTLGEAWREMPAEWRGERFREPGDFPLLLKFIFPQEKLSIQVHPDDAYAALHEKAAGGRGKTEMWHVVSAESGAKVLIGLRPGVDKQKFLAALDEHTVEDLFVAHQVHAGDTFFVPAGTPHTIGPGMVICEVQQYSDLTYRVYDYGRVDAQGKPRELHIEKATRVMDFNAVQEFKTQPLVMGREGMELAIDDRGSTLLAACRYFAAGKWDLSRAQKWSSEDETSQFVLSVFLAGTGQLEWKEGSGAYKAGECWFTPAEMEDWSVIPYQPTSILTAVVPDLPAVVRELKSEGFTGRDLSQTIFA